MALLNTGRIVYAFKQNKRAFMTIVTLGEHKEVDTLSLLFDNKMKLILKSERDEQNYVIDAWLEYVEQDKYGLAAG